MQKKKLDTIISEHQSEVIKNRITLLYTLFLLFVRILMSQINSIKIFL